MPKSSFEPTPKPAESPQRVEVRASASAADRLSIAKPTLSVAKQHQRRKARLGALTWLKRAYPALFDYPPKPLAIGVGKAMIASVLEAGMKIIPCAPR